MDPVKEAWNHIHQGKRHLVIRDYNSAVQSLEEGCKLLDQTYGVSADECGDAYFYYGLALFELARQETGALNGVGETGQEEQSEDEEEGADGEEEEGDDDEEEQADEMPSSSRVVGQADFEEDITRSPRASNQQNDDEMMDEGGMDFMRPSTSSGLTDADREAAVDEEDDSNVSTIEIAWEVLKLAKNVYERQLNYKEGVHLNLAETVQKLGEIYIEWENFDEALTELQFCLQIRQQQLAPDSRLIAETFYHIGLAQSFKNDLESAEQSFRYALEVIEARINHKQQELSMGYSLDQEARSNLESEITELQGLLPEMRFKIEDCQETRRNISLASSVVENDKLEEQRIAERSRENQYRPVNNLSHLVKRKRDERDNSIGKKLRSQNGDHLLGSNGHNNGYGKSHDDDSMAMAD